MKLRVVGQRDTLGPSSSGVLPLDGHLRGWAVVGGEYWLFLEKFEKVRILLLLFKGQLEIHAEELAEALWPEA